MFRLSPADFSSLLAEMPFGQALRSGSFRDFPASIFVLLG